MEKYLFFWRQTERPYGAFSQWARSRFTVDGVAFNTAEQYMMYSKAMLFGDLEKAAEIMATADPREQKRLGREVRGFKAERWEKACLETVVRGNLAKFSQNQDLRELLLGTGDRVLAEASPSDAIWGIGLSAEDPAALDESRWGRNLLGKALAEVRSILKTQNG
jgi:ribA/ribD-fused uncharacterized protein